MISFNDRQIDYLRISVTDRCNLQCMYCVPEEGIAVGSHGEILTYEEITRLTEIFADLGIEKIRITGGEPLARNGVSSLVKSLSSIEKINQLCLTTNAVFLAPYAKRLKEAGLNNINISLDTLSEAKFRRITRKSYFPDVMKGIEAAQRSGFYPLKLNVVIMKGVNDDEIGDFISFARSRNLILRFIEFMKITPLWNKDFFMPIEEIKNIAGSVHKLTELGAVHGSAASYCRTEKDNIIGFINTNEANCARCSRLRLSATGELKICLYEKEGIQLKHLLRGSASDWEIMEIIKERLSVKCEVNYRNYESSKLYMSKIGG